MKPASPRDPALLRKALHPVPGVPSPGASRPRDLCEAGEAGFEIPEGIDIPPGGEELGLQAEGRCPLQAFPKDLRSAPGDILEESGRLASHRYEVVPPVVTGSENDVGALAKEAQGAGNAVPG